MQITAFGRNLKALRENKGITQRQLADLLQTTQTSVSSWETRGIEPRQKETIAALCDLFDCTERDLCGYTDGYYSLKTGVDSLPEGAILPRGSTSAAPLLGWVHAGEPNDENVLDDEVQLPQHVLEAHPHGFFLRVEGDCMNKLYPAGCYVFVDPETTPWNGCTAAVELDNYEAVLRTYFRGRDTLMLIADSFADYDDILITDQTVRLIGVVVWFQADKMIEP